MALTNQQAHAIAEKLLEKLIEHQVLVLPSTREGTRGDGAKDAEYIKSLLKGMAQYYLERPVN